MPGRNGGTLAVGHPPSTGGDLDGLIAGRVAGLSIPRAAVAAGYAVDAGRHLLRRGDIIERVEAGKRELREDLHARINAASGEVVRVHLAAMKAVDTNGYPTMIALRAAENLLNRLAPATQQIAVEQRSGPQETPEDRNRRLDGLLANIEARLALPEGERERDVVSLVAEHDITDAEIVQ